MCESNEERQRDPKKEVVASVLLVALRARAQERAPRSLLLLRAHNQANAEEAIEKRSSSSSSRASASASANESAHWLALDLVNKNLCVDDINAQRHGKM